MHAVDPLLIATVPAEQLAHSVREKAHGLAEKVPTGQAAHAVSDTGR